MELVSYRYVSAPTCANACTYKQIEKENQESLGKISLELRDVGLSCRHGILQHKELSCWREPLSKVYERWPSIVRQGHVIFLSLGRG